MDFSNLNSLLFNSFYSVTEKIKACISKNSMQKIAWDQLWAFFFSEIIVNPEWKFVYSEEKQNVTLLSLF